MCVSVCLVDRAIHPACLRSVIWELIIMLCEQLAPYITECARGLGLSRSTCCLFTFSQPCVWPTKPDSSMLTHILISSLAWCVWASEISQNRRHVSAMWCGPLVGPIENWWLVSASFPASGRSFLSVKQNTGRNITAKSLDFKRRSWQPWARMYTQPAL